MQKLKVFCLALSIFVFACASTSLVAAQTPNTSSMIVVVEDQNGAVVPGATVSVVNTATGDSREAVAGDDGVANFSALSLTGTYTVTVSKSGFANQELRDVALRSGETATLKVKLPVGAEKAEVTVYGTAEGVRADAQIGRRFDSPQIDETPILGRKVSSLPLLNSAFRQGKGTGDLFVNQTYFITGVGSRRATTFLLDGANNDEGWGRQTAIATVPIGAVQEVTVLSNAFSSEFGWTSGPALNIITKSGTNEFHGEGIFMVRPGDWQAKKFSTDGFCPPSLSTCVTPSTLQRIDPVDIPDALQQYSASIGGPIVKDKTFFFMAADYTRQNRTTFLSTSLPAFLLPADGHLDYTGHYRQTLFDGRLDHKLTSNQNLMFRFNLDRMSDDNPQDAVGGTNAPSVARRYTRRSWTLQANHTTVVNARVLNEARFAYLHGDPVTLWEAQTLSTVYTRAGTGGSVPFTIGQSRSSDLWGHQWQLADTLSWAWRKHYLRFGGSVIRHTSGGTGSEPGTPILGTFNFSTTDASRTLPFNQLTLANVLNYQQPINFGISSYELPQWLITGFVQDSIRVTPNFMLELGLRYDRQTLTADKNNFAPRVGFAWSVSEGTVLRGGYGVYYDQSPLAPAEALYFNSPFFDNNVFFPLQGLPLTVNNPFPSFFPFALPDSALAIQRDLRTGYMQHWNFNVERQLGERNVVEVAYVGSKGTKLLTARDINQPQPSVLPQGLPFVPRPNPQFDDINLLESRANSNYHALQARFQRRMTRGFSTLASYTWSKSLDDASNFFTSAGDPNFPQNSYNVAAERGRSNFDVAHRLSVSYSYALPFHSSGNDLGAKLVNGWETFGILTLQSGRPFTVALLSEIDNSGTGRSILGFGNNDRPNLIGNPDLSDPTPDRWFNTAAFAFSAPGTFGNAGRNIVDGPGYQSFNAAVVKNTHFSERVSLQFRAEAFNFFNHPNFNLPDNFLGSPTFGRITSARDPRHIQFGLKLLF